MRKSSSGEMKDKTNSKSCLTQADNGEHTFMHLTRIIQNNILIKNPLICNKYTHNCIKYTEIYEYITTVVFA